MKEREINNINVYNYLKTHSPQVLYGVVQFLEAFECGCDDLLETLNAIEEDRLERKKRQAEERRETGKALWESKGGNLHRKQVREIPPLNVIMEICPKCGKAMKGEPERSCEKMEKGPVFYAECEACPYYYEMWRNFKTGKIWREEEGG